MFNVLFDVFFLRQLDLNIQNSAGDTALHAAARWGFMDIVKILVKHILRPIFHLKQVTIDFWGPTSIILYIILDCFYLFALE